MLDLVTGHSVAYMRFKEEYYVCIYIHMYLNIHMCTLYIACVCMYKGNGMGMLPCLVCN